MPTGEIHIAEPWEWVRTKVCTHCGEKKPWAQFSPSRRWPDGTVRYVNSSCRACRAEQSRGLLEQRAAYRERNRERLRTYHRHYQRRWRQQERREAAHKDSLPSTPFRMWLAERYDEVGSWVEISMLSGVNERVLRRVMFDGIPTVSRPAVDRCLTAFGQNMGELYD